MAIGLWLGIASPAPAQLIDSFTTGAFNFQAGPSGATATQVCGSFCLSGTREVFLQSNAAGFDAFVQLSFSTGEAANVMPEGGGQLAFSYPVAGTPVSLTQGGTALVLQVWFTAFEPGAEVSVRLQDDTGVSQVVVLNPAFAPAPSLGTPANVDFPLADFAPVDLEHIVAVEVRVAAPDAGDYHLTLIIVPLPSSIKLAIGNSSLTGGPYPTDPIKIEVAVAQPPEPSMPTVKLELSLLNVTNADNELGSVQVRATEVSSPDGDAISLASQFVGIQPTPFQAVYRIGYSAVGGGLPDDGIPMLWWTNKHFEVMVYVAVDDGGVQTLMLFGELLDPASHFVNVAASKGASTLITLDISSSEDTASVQMTLGGSFTPAPTFAIDHFSVYRARGPEPPASFQTVKLRDQFNEEEVGLGALDLFLVPADKNAEGLQDRISHLACNPILDGTPGFPEVLVSNQFGEATLGVGVAQELCVPTENLLTPGVVKIDHFKCYEANGEPVDVNAILVDPFQDWGGLVLDPFLLCNPVDKNGEGILNVDDHLVCYFVTPPGEPLDVEIPIADQIYPEVDIAVFEPFALCVPSKKELPEPGLLVSLASGLLGLAALTRWRTRGWRDLGAT